MTDKAALPKLPEPEYHNFDYSNLRFLPATSFTANQMRAFYAKGYEDARQAIAMNAQAPDWMPMESAPKAGVPILVVADGNVGEARLDAYGEYFWANMDRSDSWANQIYPTLWMPLPAPPPPTSEDEA